MKITRCDRCKQLDDKGSYTVGMKSVTLPVPDTYTARLKWTDKPLDLCYKCYEDFVMAVGRFMGVWEHPDPNKENRNV